MADIEDPQRPEGDGQQTPRRSSTAAMAAPAADAAAQADERRGHGSFGKSIAAVLWSFMGIRKGRDRERDFAQLNPIHLVIAAVLCTAILIGILIAIVTAVTR